MHGLYDFFIIFPDFRRRHGANLRGREENAFLPREALGRHFFVLCVLRFGLFPEQGAFAFGEREGRGKRHAALHVLPDGVGQGSERLFGIEIAELGVFALGAQVCTLAFGEFLFQRVQFRSQFQKFSSLILSR